MIEQPSPRSEMLTELPVEVSPERALEVSDFYAQILAEHGTPTELPVMGRRRVNMWPGVEAEFDAGDRRFHVQRWDNTDVFPKVRAFFTEKTDDKHRDGSPKWARTDEFDFDLKTQELTYQHGGTLLFARSERRLRHGVEGVQRAGKRGGITVNVTPPTDEGVVTMLDQFLEDAAATIEASKRPARRFATRAKRIGHTVTKFFS